MNMYLSVHNIIHSRVVAGYRYRPKDTMTPTSNTRAPYVLRLVVYVSQLRRATAADCTLYYFFGPLLASRYVIGQSSAVYTRRRRLMLPLVAAYL